LRSEGFHEDRYSVLDFTPQGKPAEAVIANGFK